MVNFPMNFDDSIIDLLTTLFKTKTMISSNAYARWIIEKRRENGKERRTVPTPRPQHTFHQTAHNRHPQSIHAAKTKVWHENQVSLDHAEAVGSVERA